MKDQNNHINFIIFAGFWVSFLLLLLCVDFKADKRSVWSLQTTRFFSSIHLETLVAASNLNI